MGELCNDEFLHGTFDNCPSCDWQIVERENPFQKLAKLFQALANICGDPKVQEAGSSLMTAVDRAIERELPEVNSLRQLADKGVDSGN